MSFTLTNIEYVLVPITVTLIGSLLTYHHTTKGDVDNYFLVEKKISPSSASIIETENPNKLETSSQLHSPTLDIVDKLTQEPIVFDYEEVSYKPNKSGKKKSITFSYSLKPDNSKWKEEFRNSFVKGSKKYEIIQWVPKDSKDDDNPKECRYSWSLQETNYTIGDTDKKRMDEQFRFIIQESQKTCKPESNKGIIISDSDSAENTV